ncbi:hypothetical protein FOG18_06920 [Legionella israelensis]|uniref:PulJ/GspJ family protein n=1 Tax=Legionella israelensis TaxID=454 RepID=UPI0011810292|nr:hypothetical protein [Legionella israelensis]QDP72307.1 hypothetical protein FOG18_06920 [Legionella israelensis]
MKSLKGVGLPEVLISLFISTLIITSLVQGYLSHKRQYLSTLSNMEIQFDINWLADLMRQSFMRVGFTPCVSLAQLTTQDRRYADKPLEYLSIQSVPEPLIAISYMGEAISEVIQIKGARHVLADRPFLLNPRHSIIITDCHYAEVQDITDIKANEQGVLIQLKKPLTFQYSDKIYIGEWIEEKWLVRADSKGKKRFYLQSHHLEELTAKVSDVKVFAHTNENKNWIDVLLKAKKNFSYHLVTMMRNL